MEFWYGKNNMSSPPEVFLGKGVLKICSKCRGEHPCRSAISIMLLCNFTEIALRHGYSSVNLLHIFGRPFPNTVLDATGDLYWPRYMFDLKCDDRMSLLRQAFLTLFLKRDLLFCLLGLTKHIMFLNFIGICRLKLTI